MENLKLKLKDKWLKEIKKTSTKWVFKTLEGQMLIGMLLGALSLSLCNHQYTKTITVLIPAPLRYILNDIFIQFSIGNRKSPHLHRDCCARFFFSSFLSFSAFLFLFPLVSRFAFISIFFDVFINFNVCWQVRCLSLLCSVSR